ncbi:MAG: Flp pilus assembly complex ATPase component TadA [Candidatus Riflebacteria bacterium]|nr:Flp pilus assembly complex ATPase component TadA [Candidatus Riflebacteria bacterium]
MEEEIFQNFFPCFPSDQNEVHKLGVILREKKIVSKEDWEKLRKENPDGPNLIKAIALIPSVSPKAFAEIEASLLNVPFIDLDTVQLSNDVLKIIKLEKMVEHRVLPIKLSGQELLLGMIAPGDEKIFKDLSVGTTLAMRGAKVLRDQLEKRYQQMTDQKKPATAAPKKSGPRKRLGDILIDSKAITAEQLKEALDNAKKDKVRLGAYLVKKGLVNNKQLSIALSKQYEIPFIDLEESLVDPVLTTLLPKKICYDQILCPVKKEDNKLVIAMTDPTDIITIDHIEMMTGLRVSPVVSSELAIFSSLDKLYGESVDSLSQKIDGADAEKTKEEELLGELGENDAPIIKLVNLILTQAAQTGTSDIHIEPFEHELRIRFRKDGALKLFMTPAKAAHAALVSRIKVMANLDIAETRCPQDGRIKFFLNNRKVDLRVSLVPCAWGEKVCMRLLDQGNLKVNLTDLGFEPHVLDVFMTGVKAANGIVLVTGPTGSGKTTTLYSSIFLLNNPGINIMTAEDPVEYNLMGINQVQCHADIGLDFGAALRSFLRQDPNVIMIGEIRDFETASIAIKAAMTGHLVISTLHTNDAPSTIGRLLQMGLEPFALTTSLRVVEAQRLVRKICKNCFAEYKPSPDVIKTLGLTEKMIGKMRLADLNYSDLTFAKGTGCEACDQTGLKGRQGIYEVLPMSQAIRELIENRASTEDLRRQALKEGMLSLRESALYKLLTKKTTVEEVIKTTLEAGGEEDSNKPKGGAAKASVSKPEGSKSSGQPSSAVSQTTFTNQESIGALTGEILAFRTAIENLNSKSGGAVKLESEIFKSNLSDPLDLIQQRVSAGIRTGDQSQLLPIIHAQGQKIDFNLKNLINHFSNPSLNPSKFSLNDFVEKEVMPGLKNSVALARILSGKASIGLSLKVSKNLAPTLPLISIDIGAIRQIVGNIISNSLIALADGGELKIMSRLKPGSTDKVELAIFDNGKGIPTEAQVNLFQPFSAFGRKTLGLGLSVSKKLIELSGGLISIKSAPGNNTLVIVEFPTAK